MLGNHRDAWVFGGVDPSSGTATEMELARTLGRLAREGHRPKRSIVLAEFSLRRLAMQAPVHAGEEHLHGSIARHHRGRRHRIHAERDRGPVEMPDRLGAGARANPRQRRAFSA